MQAYFGKITLTSNSSLLNFFGSEPTTSANPPVLIKGTDYDDANKILFIKVSSTCYLNNICIFYCQKRFGSRFYLCFRVIHFMLFVTCTVALPMLLFYLCFCSRRIVSATSAINSELVGFPFPLLTV